MPRTALDRAERLFRAGRFAELVQLLEPQLPVYRESQRYYYLLGASCLRSGDPGAAHTYLKRAEQLSPAHEGTMLGLAALALRRGETERAVDYYLQILDMSPRSRRAKDCLSLLRREGSPEALALLVESGKIERLYPRAGGLPPALSRAALVLAIAIALGLAAWLAGPALASAAAGIARGSPARPEVAAVALSKAERDDPVATGGSFRYLLSESEALKAFERAKDYFQAYRDNAAMVEINRLLLSNAREGVKAKAKTLRAFVGAPDFRTIRDAPAYARVLAEPGLYDGCSIAWKGMAANVRAVSGGTAFDFLVGYQDKQRLEGIASARIPGGEVPVDRPLELLALVRASGAGFSLEGVAIHELSGTR